MTETPVPFTIKGGDPGGNAAIDRMDDATYCALCGPGSGTDHGHRVYQRLRPMAADPSMIQDAKAAGISEAIARISDVGETRDALALVWDQGHASACDDYHCDTAHQYDNPYRV